jgi:hypothetical protein
MKRMHGEKGAALLEAAITVPIILLISVGIFEFGRAYQTQQVLTNAAREGARMAVIDGSTDAAVRDRVREFLTGGGLTTLPDEDILINRDVTIEGTAKGSQVQIIYPFQFIVLNPIIRMIAPGDTTTGAPINMGAVTTMRNEG